MKKMIFTLLIVFTTIACTSDGSESLELSSSSLELAKILNPQVGGKIPNSDAHSWVNRYENLHTSEAMSSSFYAQRELIESLLNIEVENGFVDGLTFAKGVDSSGEATLVIVPVKDGVTLFSMKGTLAGRADNETLYQLSDNDDGVPISLADAREVTKKYQSASDISEANPKSYFIGRESLLEMLGHIQSPVNGLRFMKAIKDDQKETLVVVSVQGSKDLWNTARSEDGDEVTYDFSKPCPSACDDEGL